MDESNTKLIAEIERLIKELPYEKLRLILVAVIQLV